MQLLLSSITNELVKLTARKKTVFLLVLIAAVPFLGLLAVQRLRSGLGVAGIQGDDYPIAVLNILTSFLLPLLAFLSAADLYAAEFGDRTIRAVLLRPVSRLKVFSAKLLALCILIAAGLLLGGVGSAIASALLPGAGITVSSLAESVLAYTVAAVPMFALAAAAALVAQLFRSASGALVVCILLYGAAKLLPFLFPQLAAFSPASYTGWHQLWIGGAADGARLATVFSFLLGCGIMMYTSGYYLFDKKEA